MKERLQKILEKFKVLVENPKGGLEEGVPFAVYGTLRGREVKITEEDVERFREVFGFSSYRVFYDARKEVVRIEGVFENEES